MSAARSVLRSSLRVGWRVLAAALIALALLLVAVRVLLPLADARHDQVADWVGRMLDRPVAITGLGASWHGLGPSIELDGFTIFDDGGRPLLQCESARIDIDVLASLRHLQLELEQLTVRGARVALLRHADGSFALLGLGDRVEAPDPAAQAAFRQWLARQPRLALEDSVFEWREADGRVHRFHGRRVQIRNRGDHHRLDAQLALPAEWGRSLTLTGELRGELFRPAAWSGRVYVRGDGVRLGPWLTEGRSELALHGGRADVELWSEWRDGLHEAAGLLAAADVRLARPGADAAIVTFTDAEARFRWRRRADGWELDAERVRLRSAAGAVAGPAQWRFGYRHAADGARQLDAGVDALALADLLALARDAGFVPAAAGARLAELAPRATLHDGYLRYRWGGAQPPAWLLRTGFKQLAFAPSGPVPGIGGLDGTLVSDGARAVLSLHGGAGAIDAGRWFRAPLPLAALSGRLAWRRLDGGWQLASDGLALRNEDVHGRVAFQLLQLDGRAPHLDLRAEFADGNGAHAARYLPAKIMHPKAVAWLDRAIVAGRVTQGSAELSGWLDEFPFDRGSGRFEVRFGVSGGVLDYAPGWPRLADIETEVRFAGRGLALRAAGASAFGSRVLAAEVAIPDLTGHPALVTVKGTARGPTADALRFIAESPLQQRFGDYLRGMTADGASRLELALMLPLADQPALVDGALRFAGGRLTLDHAGLALEQIDGTLGFYEGGLRGRGLRARLLGQPTVIDVRSEGDAAAHATVFDAEGSADAAAVAAKFLPPLAPHVQGTAPWRGRLRVAAAAGGGTRLEIESPLTGVAVGLPAPLAKPAAAAQAFALELPLPLDGERETHVRYGAALDARLLLAAGDDGVALGRGELRLGGGAAVLPRQPLLRVRGRVPQLVLADWLALRTDATPTGRGTGAAVPPLEFALGVDELRVLGQRFDNAALRARRAAGDWTVEVDAPALAGHLHLPADAGAPLAATFARLHLVPPAAVAAAPAAAASDTLDPRTLPPLAVQIADFRYGKFELGDLRLRTARSERGMIVESLAGASPLHGVEARGRWELADGGPRSAFELAFDSADMGETLRSLGYADVVKDGKMHTDMKLAWPGGPADFALAAAAGTVAFKITDGRLLEVNPGAGRILGLLSFQALPRRLSLDFSDLFQKGWTFDALAGDFAVEDGVARTDNLTMDGPAARIVARGRVGLAAEDYDQHVTVIPNVSAGLPLAGALAGGVATGAALLLVERLLKERIDEMGRVEYQVTGPWTAPVVERIAGISKDGDAMKRPNREDRGQ